jgi:hypothetical protein
MKITRTGSDFIVINEDNLYDESLKNIPRIHLIKLKFSSPSEDKVRKVISLYPKTNRFVIDDNIREYNGILKWTNKKYYVENTEGSNIITFFRKNNKILLNFLRLSPHEKQFILYQCFEDALRNVEVIMIDKDILEEKEEILKIWNGNVIVDGMS